MLIKKGGFYYYRTIWRPIKAYPRPPTEEETRKGAGLWLSCMNGDNWICCFDEFEIKRDEIPVGIWCKKERYAEIQKIKKDKKIFFVQACIDMTGVAGFCVYYSQIGISEKAQFWNEMVRAYTNLIENNDNNNDLRRRLIGEKPIVFYVDRATYNTSEKTQDILQVNPTIQLAVRATSQFNPIE